MFKKTLKSDLLLLAAALIWGTGFVAQRKGMEHIGPMSYTALRFLLGGLVLVPVLPHLRRFEGATRLSRRHALLWGCLAGLVIFCGAALQQIGLVYTAAGKAGFLTGLYVVFVAFIGRLLGHRIGWERWAGSLLAVAGMYLLSVKQSFSIGKGDLYVVCSAVFWAIHMQMVGYLTKRIHPLSLACVQFFACALLGLCAAALFETPSVGAIRAAGGAILYGGVLSVGVAFSLQVISQRTCPPSHAAVIMSMEAVFAVAAGWLVLNESLSRSDLAGCALMLAGMITVQLDPRSWKRQEKEKTGTGI